MTIEQFVARSEGEWRSMRSGHSLAFQQFEQILSTITVKILGGNDPRVIDLLSSSPENRAKYTTPFLIQWEAESDWSKEISKENSSGSSILIPIPKTKSSGLLIRSIGYTEAIPLISTYCFLSDGTFKLKSKYEKTTTEERIWHLSENVRCRSSVVYTTKTSGILQTSFASEIKHLKP
ncbi:phycobiliprotein lyase [Prochlorococcus sp. MIT 1307]|uniref:phycobiliprotein lyase n=1 Tax=Prochlorococcus sp. MIT 1307 TaxID=3096219 RepID=UPI002A762E49|nr:phycobiliprotein lyase [Prochlorococcus sp. MIT 1307]